MTHYEWLGVEPEASPAEVREAFRRAVNALHPDRHGDGTTADMSSVNLAWWVLSDPTRRAAYDAGLQREAEARRREAEARRREAEARRREAEARRREAETRRREAETLRREADARHRDEPETRHRDETETALRETTRSAAAPVRSPSAADEFHFPEDTGRPDTGPLARLRSLIAIWAVVAAALVVVLFLYAFCQSGVPRS